MAATPRPRGAEVGRAPRASARPVVIMRAMPTRRGQTLSDLHLLTERSTADRYAGPIRDAAAGADLFVLNGDIFDFKWSTHRRLSRSLRSAEGWLDALVRTHPGCQFVVLTGNHDDLPEYREVLDGLARRRPNLRWERHTFRLGGKVFLHGDAMHGAADDAELDAFRARHRRRRPMGRTARRLYRAATAAHLHVGVARAAPLRAVAGRVQRYLDGALTGGLDGVEQVYFGHLHRAFDGLDLHGRRFHNSGAAIRGLRLLIQPFEYTDDELG